MTNMTGSIGDFAGMNSISQFNQIFKQNLAGASSAVDGENGASFAQGINPSDILNGKINFNAEGQRLTNDTELTNDLKALVGSSPVSGGSSASQVSHDFSHALSNSLNDLNQSQKVASDSMETFASGGDIDVHSVMIAAEKANLNMNMALQLRNKFVKAYQEISAIHV